METNIVNKSMKGVSLSLFKEYISYNPETGLFHWRKPRRKISVGSPAFNTPQSSGYLEGGFMLKRFLSHRVAFFMHEGWVPSEIDHINLDRKDNRIINLRASNPLTNSYNLPRRVDNTSGYKGVCFDKRKGKWMSRIHSDNKTHFIGYFNNKEDAALAYKEAAISKHGEFMRIE